MTKLKQVEVEELTAEEIEFLEAEKARKAASGSGMPQMKQLIMNADKVDEEGNKIEPDTFHIRNEKGAYVDTVTFRPLRYVSKFIRMIQNDKKQWKIDNESIFVSGWEPAYDIKGTVGCGRIIGTLPSTWNDDQKLANYKKANIYGFLFGLVTFPGQTPELVNFRVPQGKTKAVREALSAKSIGDKKEIYAFDYTLKLKQIKGDKYPVLEMTPELKNEYTRFPDIIPYMKEVDAYTSAHNKRIMSARERMAENIKASETFNEIGKLSDDFNDEHDDLDDVLPR